MEIMDRATDRAKGNLRKKTGKRELTRQRNRLSILTAARECFADKGYEQVTVRDIIGKTDLASGTFYNYFTDKESIFRAILDDYMARLNVRLHELRQQAKSLEQYIYTTYLALFQAIAEDPIIYKLAHDNHRAIRHIYDAGLLGETMAFLESDIQISIEHGLIPPIDIQFLVAAFFGVAYEMGLAVAKRSANDVEAAARFATQLFVGGIQEISGAK